MLYNFLISVFAIIGIYISFRIHQEKKKKNEKMICPLDGSCEDVLTSKYAKISGISLEYFGILYYAILFIGNILTGLGILLMPLYLQNWILFVITTLGMLFSVYLTYIQKYKIKKWCTWCLFSAGITAIIFLLSYIKNVF